MSFFRRREPLHERLAREGGLWAAGPEPYDPSARWGVPGIHGGARSREWDAVVAAEAPGLDAGELELVVLADGTVVVDDERDLDPGALDPLTSAVEALLPRPYRASALWRGGSRWVVAARRITVAELPASVLGDEIVLSIVDGERSLVVDGLPSFGSLPALERLGEARSSSYVVRAERLGDVLWEVKATAL